MADEMGDGMMDYRFQTEDSYPPARPAVGGWKAVEHPETDETYKEIQEYCKFRDQFRKYLGFLLAEDFVRRLPKKCHEAWSILDDMMDRFPVKRQLLLSPRWPREVVRLSYHTSYLVLSDRSMFSRSAILTALPRVVAKMREYKDMFWQAVKSKDECQRLYDEAIQAFMTWRAMAEAALRVSSTAVRGRDTHGRFGRRRANSAQLLAELNSFLQFELEDVDVKK
jgi:hypothetical protein